MWVGKVARAELLPFNSNLMSLFWTSAASGAGLEWNVKASAPDNGWLATDAQVPPRTIEEIDRIVDSL
jgi:hypothetical protein